MCTYQNKKNKISHVFHYIIHTSIEVLFFFSDMAGYLILECSRMTSNYYFLSGDYLEM